MSSKRGPKASFKLPPNLKEKVQRGDDDKPRYGWQRWLKPKEFKDRVVGSNKTMKRFIVVSTIDKEGPIKYVKKTIDATTPKAAARHAIRQVPGWPSSHAFVGDGSENGVLLPYVLEKVSGGRTRITEANLKGPTKGRIYPVLADEDVSSSEDSEELYKRKPYTKGSGKKTYISHVGHLISDKQRQIVFTEVIKGSKKLISEQSDKRAFQTILEDAIDVWIEPVERTINLRESKKLLKQMLFSVIGQAREDIPNLPPKTLRAATKFAYLALIPLINGKRMREAQLEKETENYNQWFEETIKNINNDMSEEEESSNSSDNQPIRNRVSARQITKTLKDIKKMLAENNIRRSDDVIAAVEKVYKDYFDLPMKKAKWAYAIESVLSLLMGSMLDSINRFKYTAAEYKPVAWIIYKNMVPLLHGKPIENDEEFEENFNTWYDNNFIDG